MDCLTLHGNERSAPFNVADSCVLSRTVAAKVLGKPERADWKRCQVITGCFKCVMTVCVLVVQYTQEQETEIVEKMKDDFREFDFTLTEGA